MESQKVVIYFIIFNLLVILGIMIARNSLPPEVPLFYGEAAGDGQLANSLYLAIPNLLAGVLGIGNFFIILRTKDWFVQRVALALTAVTTFLATITIIKIIFLVGNII